MSKLSAAREKVNARDECFDPLPFPKTIAPPAKRRQSHGLARAGTKLALYFRSKQNGISCIAKPAAVATDMDPNQNGHSCNKSWARQSEAETMGIDLGYPGAFPKPKKRVSFSEIIQTFDDRYVSPRRTSIKVFLKSALKSGTRINRDCPTMLDPVDVQVQEVEVRKSVILPKNSIRRKATGLKRIPTGIKNLVFGGSRNSKEREDELFFDTISRNEKDKSDRSMITIQAKSGSIEQCKMVASLEPLHESSESEESTLESQYTVWSQKQSHIGKELENVVPLKKPKPDPRVKVSNSSSHLNSRSEYDAFPNFALTLPASKTDGKEFVVLPKVLSAPGSNSKRFK